MAESFSSAMRRHMHMGASQAMRAAWADVRAGRAAPPPKRAASRVALAVRGAEKGSHNTRRYAVQRLESPSRFDPRSFRTVSPKRGVRITVGCPKGKYHRHTKRCRVATRSQRIMRRRNPLYKQPPKEYWDLMKEADKVYSEMYRIRSSHFQVTSSPFAMGQWGKQLPLGEHASERMKALTRERSKLLSRARTIKKKWQQAGEPLTEHGEVNPPKKSNPLTRGETARVIRSAAGARRVASDYRRRYGVARDPFHRIGSALQGRADAMLEVARDYGTAGQIGTGVRGTRRFRRLPEPWLGKSNPPATPIYGRVMTITARKTSGPHAGKAFQHTFGPKAKAYGLPNGDVLLTTRRI